MSTPKTDKMEEKDKVVPHPDDYRIGEVKKQVAFYFSNSNLPRDKFLRNQVSNDPEGYVDITLIASFKRIRELGGSAEDIVKAFEGSDFLGVSEDKKRIRRKTPLPAVDDSQERIAIVKGFPTTLTQKELENYFDLATSGAVYSVRMRRVRGKGRAFKGSAFVEFKTKDAMSKFLAETPKYEKTDLEAMTKTQWHENKKKQYAEFKRTREVAEFNAQLEEVKEKYAGCYVKITEIPTDKGLTFRNIKECFADIGKCFVDFPFKGEPSQALIRFYGTEEVKKANAMEIKLGEKVVKLVPVTKEEEEEACKKLTEKMLNDPFEPRRKKRKTER